MLGCIQRRFKAKPKAWSDITFTASETFSKLSNGSPIPIKTTLKQKDIAFRDPRVTYGSSLSLGTEPRAALEANSETS